MAPETKRAPTVLSADEVGSFHERGFVRLKAAFPRELALEMQAEIWTELEQDHGIRRDEPATWRQPPRSPKRAKESSLNASLVTARFTGAIDDLLGREDWPRPATWGGFNVFFPAEPRSKWMLPTEIWHWDGSPTSEGLLILSFYGEVHPGGGGTLIVEGSQRLIRDYYASLPPGELARPHKFHRKSFTRQDPWLEALTGQSKAPVVDRGAAFMERTSDVRGVPCRVVELTGEPGDTVFCDLRVLHCVAPNASDQPRFLRVKFFFLHK